MKEPGLAEPKFNVRRAVAPVTATSALRLWQLDHEIVFVHEVEQLTGALVKYVEVKRTGPQCSDAAFDGLVLFSRTVPLGASQLDLMSKGNITAQAAFAIDRVIGKVANHSDAQQRGKNLPGLSTKLANHSHAMRESQGRVARQRKKSL